MIIHYETDERDLPIKSGQRLLDVCLNSKVDISHSCEGMASCGTCRVIVTGGLENLHPRNYLEQEMADDRNFRPEERLACQIHPDSNLNFKLPNE